MAITRAAGFPTNNTTSATSISPSWVNVGDLAIVQVASFSTQADTISGVSSSKVTGWAQIIDAADATEGWSLNIWAGTTNATGSDTVTVTWTGGTPGAFETVVDELHSGLGSTNVWATVASASLRAASSPFNYPSLTSNTVTLQAYWGYMGFAGSGTNGSTAGFTYTATSTFNIVVFDGGLAASTAFQPSNSTGSSGPSFAAAGIVSVALPGGASGEPDLIMAPMRGFY